MHPLNDPVNKYERGTTSETGIQGPHPTISLGGPMSVVVFKNSILLRGLS